MNWFQGSAKKVIISSLTMLFLLSGLIGAVFLVQQRQVIQKKATGPQLLDKVNIDLKQGGAITYVGVDGQNAVDTHDCGRLIQIALYDAAMPKVIAGSECLSRNPSYTVAWDPVQACDACETNHPSEILAGNDKSYIRVRPRLWVGNGAVGDFIIEQRISQTQFSNAVKVSYKIIHDGTDYHKKLDIEFPATWIENRFSKFVYYNGNHPWENAGLNTVTSDLHIDATTFLGTESWGALVDPSNNRGIGVYAPASVFSMEFLTDPANGSNHPRYSTSWLVVEFPPKTEVSFDIYILTGSAEEIRNTVYQLPRNTNYLVEPVSSVPLQAKPGETVNFPVKVTNKSLVPFYKEDQATGTRKTMIGVDRKPVDGGAFEAVTWIPLNSDVMPGQSITMNLPVAMPSTTGQYKYVFNVLSGLELWMTSSGFPMYSFVVDVESSVLPEPANSVSVGTVEPIRAGTTITGYKTSVTVTGNPAPAATFGGETPARGCMFIRLIEAPSGASELAIKNSLASDGAICLNQGEVYEHIFPPESYGQTGKFWATFHNDSATMASNYWPNLAWSIPQSSATVNVPLLPTPPPTTPISLTFSARLRGISMSGVTKALEIRFVSGATDRSYEFTVASGNNGVFSVSSLPLTGLTPGSYTVYIRDISSGSYRGNHLRKNLGNITLIEGLNTAPSTWGTDSQYFLKPGDVIRDGTENNVVNITDIAAELSVYTALSVPVNDSNRVFDINGDNRISVEDISLILGIYTALSVPGD